MWRSEVTVKTFFDLFSLAAFSLASKIAPQEMLKDVAKDVAEKMICFKQLVAIPSFHLLSKTDPVCAFDICAVRVPLRHSRSQGLKSNHLKTGRVGRPK